MKLISKQAMAIEWRSTLLDGSAKTGPYYWYNGTGTAFPKRRSRHKKKALHENMTTNPDET